MAGIGISGAGEHKMRGDPVMDPTPGQDSTRSMSSTRVGPSMGLAFQHAKTDRNRGDRPEMVFETLVGVVHALIRLDPFKTGSPAN